MNCSNEEIAVLLYSFQEKDDKNNGKTSYTANIKIAEKRINELIDELIDNDESLNDQFELDDILVDISMKFINYRIENNLTQKQLAKKLDVSQSMISKFESGEYNPTVD